MDLDVNIIVIWNKENQHGTKIWNRTESRVWSDENYHARAFSGDNIDDIDRSRVIRHELRHTSVDDEAKKNPYKVRTHTIEDFYSEVDLNADDPRWRARVATLLNVKYEAQNNANLTNQPGLF